MAVIVTGGAGFIGSHLVDRVIEDGGCAIVVDDLSTGRLSNIERSLPSGRLAFVYADVRELAFDELIERTEFGPAWAAVETVYHLASPPAASDPDRESSTDVADRAVTTRVLELAALHRAKFLYVSRPCDSGAQEDLIVATSERLGVDARIVRVDDCYGPRMRRTGHVAAVFEALLANRAIPVHHDAAFCRPTYVGDVVDGIRWALDGGSRTRGPLNLLGAAEISHEQLARIAAETATSARHGIPTQRRPADAVGRRQHTPLADGIAVTYAWFAQRAVVIA